MPHRNLRLAIAQMTSTDRFEENLTFVLKAIEQSGHDRAELLVFPENTLYLRLQAREAIRDFALDEPASAAIQAAVDASKVSVLLTTPTRGVGGKSKNSTILWQPGLRPEIVYSKIHMFDVDVEGAPPVRESEKFESGSSSQIIELFGWKIGLSICYDLRFPELYLNYADQVDLILVPAAFLVPTGQAHWHVLLRARAIENQCFLAAPAQAGEHRSQDTVRRTYGHSLAVDPWGVVLFDNDGGPGVKTVELNFEKLDVVRKQIPMARHRRMLRS
jgi:predicted amidohydrolase